MGGAKELPPRGGVRAAHPAEGAGLVWLLVFLLALHAAGLYLFTAGFLLTRIELPGSSACNTPGDADWRPPRDATGCWGPRLFNKTVIVVIDALRYDMAMDACECPTGKSFHCGKLPVLQSILQRKGSASTLVKFSADAPTTTMQRLKGLMTGGLPTFIDVGSSFGAEEVTEDNLLKQLHDNQRRVVVVGDDTWVQLFPSQLAAHHVFPSLNVKDLHGVDNGVKALLPGLLRSPEKWDVLILHFLGVDHVGHVHGVESSHMEAKLAEMDGVIGQVTRVLEKGGGAGGAHADTLLVVMGDHGQTLHGDHGGGTPDEVDSALFAYSPRPLNPRAEVSRSSLGTGDGAGRDGGEGGGVTMPQVDFAPSMALLLGVPTPFGSVGRVSPHLWAVAPRAWEGPPARPGGELSTGNLPPQGEGGRSGGMEYWVGGYVAALRANSWQVQRYLERYNGAGARAALFPPEQFGVCARLRDAARARGCAGGRRDGEDLASLLAEKHALLAHLDAAVRLARCQFTQFRPAAMACGILLLSLALAVQAAAAIAAPASPSPSRSTVVLSFCSLAAAGLAYESVLSEVTVAIVCGVTGAAVLRDLCTPLGRGAPSSRHRGLARGGCGEYAVLVARSLQSEALVWVLAAVHAASQLSNSFIVAEGSVVRFITATLGAASFMSSLRRGEGKGPSVVMLVAGAALYEVGARQDGFGSVVSSEGSLHPSRLVLAVRGLPHVLLPILLHRFGTGLEARALQAGAPRTTARSSYRLSCVASCVMHAGVAMWWACQDDAPPPGGRCRLWLPRCVYATFSAAAAAVVGLNVVRGARCDGEGRDIRSARRSLEVLFLCSAPVAMLLGKTGPMALLLAACQGGSFALSQAPVGWGPAASGLAWSWLMLSLFFGTAHQCTFGALHFTAGFTGLDEFDFWLSGGLLAVNTFAAHLMLSASLPLMTLATGARLSADFGGFREAALAFGLGRALTTTVAAVLAAVERRHLMVWALFAPKYVFEGCGLVTVDVLVLVCALLS